MLLLYPTGFGSSCFCFQWSLGIFFLISSFVSSVIHWLFSIMLSLHVFMLLGFVGFFFFFSFFLYLTSNLTALLAQKMLHVISTVLNLSSHALQPSMWSWRMFPVHLKRMCILLSDGTLYRYQLSPSDSMCHLRPVFPSWFLSLADLPTAVDRVSL